MKKTITLILVMLISLLCLSTSVMAAQMPENVMPGDLARTAGENTNEDDGVMPINLDEESTNGNDNGHSHNDAELYEGDLYIASTDMEYVMDKAVNGNVFIVGKNVKITGQIYGSLFVFSDKVTIDKDAYITSHIFTCADTVSISGTMFDVYSASRNLIVNENTIIYRDIKGVAENVYLGGIVERDVSLTAEKIEISEQENGLMIGRNFTYETENELTGLDKARILGETKFIKYVEENGNVVSDYIVSAVGTVLFDIVLYMLLLFLAPKFIEKSKEYVSTKGLLAFAIGLAFTIIVPILAFILMITGVGAGLGMFAIFVYATVLMMNAFIVAATANEFIASKIKISEDKLKKSLLLIPVSLVIWGLRKLPVVGTGISILVFLCGIGIVILYQFDKRRKSEHKV